MKMKKFTAIFITAALTAALTGCDKPSDSGDSTPTEPTSTITDSTVESADSASPEESALEGEPTNLTALDGKPIYTSEINTDITDPEIIERLSDYTYYAEPIKPDAMVDSFLFFRPSTGISYDVYSNPELFTEDELGYTNFIGEAPENTNEWRRVNVGDEICGLTLKTAETGLTKQGENSYSPTGQYYCEFDGTLTLTGLLYIMSAAELYNLPGGEMSLFFPNSELPLLADSALAAHNAENAAFTDSIIFNHPSFYGISELPELILDETIDETTIDMAGLTRGDLAKVKVTVSNFRCLIRANSPNPEYSAHLENIELLSDIIEND